MEVKRYSDADLAEFKELVEKKLAKAKKEMDYLQEQILEATELFDDDRGDWMDDSSNGHDIEMLNTMAIRLRKHLRDLENALLRIQNKTYGICVITGELIDKNRLRAVPTATKSVEGKMAEKLKEKPTTVSRPTPKPSERQIITKVIKPASKPKSTAPKPEDDDEDWVDFDMDSLEDDDDFLEEDSSDAIDPDNLSDDDIL